LISYFSIAKPRYGAFLFWRTHFIFISLSNPLLMQKTNGTKQVFATASKTPCRAVIRIERFFIGNGSACDGERRGCEGVIWNGARWIRVSCAQAILALPGKPGSVTLAVF
jgi:hypothetical protein